MSSQGALFGSPPASVEDSGLVKGVESTLTALEESGALRDTHRGMVELIRAESRDYMMARGIARTNYARLLGEHLNELLDLEVVETGDDVAGNRVTKLSEFLKAQRVDPDDSDAAAS